jgi:hypothetical protein
METLDLAAVHRLALARAGLLKPAWTGLPERGNGRGARARRAALEVIRRFGYLQLDTVSVAGARSHSIVLHSRLEGFDAELGEELLRPGEPLFEYWGHEACWLPIELYPVFAFRRRAFRKHPWWGDLIGSHARVARDLRRRIRSEGALRSVDLEGEGSRGWWDLKVAKKVAIALWSSGELAIRERRSFQRSYDLAERVIPGEHYRAKPLPKARALEQLLLLALQGHGWAQTGTLARTWRLTNMGPEIAAALERMRRAGKITECGVHENGRRVSGWIRPEDLELAARLRSVRLRTDRGVLLSPFDPLLWDRARVQLLFGFDQVLEIFKPASKRKYGYYCMPVLAGDRLVARFDLKSERKEGRLRIVSARLEDDKRSDDRAAARSALERYAGAVGLEPPAWRG